MRRLLALLLISLAAIVSGCGHSAIDYTPKPLASATDRQVALVVQLGISSLSDERAMLTRDFIAVIERKPASETHLGSAIPGLSTPDFVFIENPERRTYYRDLGIPIISKSNSRSDFYGVAVVDASGSIVRSTYFSSERGAKDFADAVMYLRQAGSLPFLSPSTAP